MRLQSLRIDIPYRPAISSVGIEYRLTVIEIVLLLGEHKQIFMTAGRAILDAFRHGVWLVPNDVSRKNHPSSCRKMQAATEFRANPLASAPQECRVSHSLLGTILFVRSSPPSVSAGVTVADVQPEDPIRFQIRRTSRKTVVRLFMNCGSVSSKPI